MNRTAFALVFLSLTQCNHALRVAMERAEAAHSRGDHFGEAVALRDACRAAPREQEICAAAKEAADEVIGRQLETARGPCDSEPNACLAALEVLQPFAGANDPRLMPYFDRAGEMLIDRCERAPLASAEDAVFHVRCAEAYRARVPTQGYANRVSLVRQRAAMWMDQAAATQAASPGVAWMHEALAACLGGQAAYAPRVERYRAAFADTHGVRLQVGGQTPYEPRALCEQLHDSVSQILSCDGRGGSTLQLSVDAWVDPMSDAPLREVRTIEVLDHTERWENPDYRYAQGAVRHARNRLEDAVKLARLAQADCQTAEEVLSRARNCTNCWQRTAQEQACNRKAATADLERRQRYDFDEAARVLQRTPAVLTRDVYRTVSYRNVEHRFRVPWHVRVALGAGPPLEKSGVLAFESTERDGVPGTNISILPYSEPTQAQRHQGLGEQALALAEAAITTELDRLAEARLAVCPPPTEPSDCQVEATLLARRDPVAEFASDVGARLDGRTGQPWPKASCAP